MKFPNSELSSFAAQTYQIVNVESACLNLQNRVAADVNILLYCCWCGDQHIALNKGDITQIIAAAAPWQDSILTPLRKARKMMKQEIFVFPGDVLDQTANNVSEVEENAERMELLTIEKTLDLDGREIDNNRTAVEICADNLAMYLQQLETVAAINEVSEDLSCLLDAIYQDAEAVQVALMSLAV
jgi:uncharacterized protein (TIGR02444 family)